MIVLNFIDGDSNITAEHIKYNKNIFLNGHNIFDSPNLLLQPYPLKYIITTGDSETIESDDRTYYKDGYTKYPTTQYSLPIYNTYLQPSEFTYLQPDGINSYNFT